MTVTVFNPTHFPLVFRHPSGSNSVSIPARTKADLADDWVPTGQVAEPFQLLNDTRIPPQPNPSEMARVKLPKAPE